ncbi:MAG: hypothetical protein WCJ58_06905 [bacterium]
MKIQNLQSKVPKIIFIVCIFTILIIGNVIAGIIWDKIFLPFHNPEEVVGPLTIIKFNPTNNILRFLLFITIPSIIFSIIFLISKFIREFVISRPKELLINDRFDYLKKITIGLLFFMGLFGFLNMLSHDLSNNAIDIFHEGEMLTPALNFIKGHGIWEGSYFVHGALQDSLISVTAWNLFSHQSITAVRLLNQIIGSFIPISVAVFFLSFLVSIKKHSKYNDLILVNLLILIYLITNKLGLQVLYNRDLPVLIAVTFLICAIKKEKKVYAFLSGTFSALTFLYSIDRGAYLTITLICTGLFLIIINKINKIKNDSYPKLVVSIFLGIIAGWISFYLFVSKVEFFNFVHSTSLLFRTKDLFDSYIYPNPIWSLRQLDLKRFLIISIISFNLLIFTLASLRDLYRKNISKSIIVSMICNILSILYYRSALGRSDLSHIYYASTFGYLTLAISFNWLLRYSRTKIKYFPKIIILLIIINSLLLLQNISRINFKNLIFFAPNAKKYVRTEDAELLSPELQSSVQILRKTFANEHCIFSLTSDAAIPYLIDKPSCGKNYIVWFASPKSKKLEIIDDLKNQQPLYILYSSNTGLSNIDGIQQPQRMKEVYDYIESKYHYSETIDNSWIIWIRNSEKVQ